MKRELKIGDKVVVVCGLKSEKCKFYDMGDTGIIKELCPDGALVDFRNQENKEVYGTGVYLMREEYLSNWIKQDPKPRFHNAQVGDLLWNDDRGICKIEDVEYSEIYPLYLSSELNGETITLEGKKFEKSPKATFFYYTPENHYLTERPEPEVDWTKVERGAEVVVFNVIPPTGEEPTCLFLGYFPEFEHPYWIFHAQTAMGFKYCKLSEPCKPEWRK